MPWAAPASWNDCVGSVHRSSAAVGQGVLVVAMWAMEGFEIQFAPLFCRVRSAQSRDVALCLVLCFLSAAQRCRLEQVSHSTQHPAPTSIGCVWGGGGGVVACGCSRRAARNCGCSVPQLWQEAFVPGPRSELVCHAAAVVVSHAPIQGLLQWRDGEHNGLAGKVGLGERRRPRRETGLLRSRTLLF